MFKFGKKSRIEREVADLEMVLVAQAVKFATFIAKAIDNMVGESEQPTYRLLFSEGPPTVEFSHANQMALAIEGLGFFVHSLNRVSFRPNSETLREIIYDPSVLQIVHLFAKMIGALSKELDTKTAEAGVLNLISERELQYAKKPFLLGKSPDDRQSAVWDASRTIAEAVGRPKHLLLIQVILSELLRALEEMDLAARVKRVEENL